MKRRAHDERRKPHSAQHVPQQVGVRLITCIVRHQKQKALISAIKSFDRASANIRSE
jgi:hypothetical protein